MCLWHKFYTAGYLFERYFLCELLDSVYSDGTCFSNTPFPKVGNTVLCYWQIVVYLVRKPMPFFPLSSKRERKKKLSKSVVQTTTPWFWTACVNFHSPPPSLHYRPTPYIQFLLFVQTSVRSIHKGTYKLRLYDKACVIKWMHFINSNQLHK